jgi:Rieske Fe-S protein
MTDSETYNIVLGPTVGPAQPAPEQGRENWHVDGIAVVFGPATRSLPQLPLAVADDGYLVAQSDFPDVVGPSYWERDA